MKLLAFADSHSHPANILHVLGQEPNVEACFFLGDGAGEPETIRQAFPKLPLYSVQGNCDPASPEPTEGLAPFGGLLFFYTHGHHYSVKENLDMLWWTAHRKHADVALFGHTHMAYYEKRGGVHLFNPGSISMPRYGPPSYGRIIVEKQEPIFEIVKLERE